MSLSDSPFVPPSPQAGVLISEAGAGGGVEKSSCPCDHNPCLPDSLRNGLRTCLGIWWLHLEGGGGGGGVRCSPN